MTLNIAGQAKSNTVAFETSALIRATGFREYDARWWFGHPGSEEEPERNLMEVQALGMGPGTMIHRMGVGPDIVHNFLGHSVASQALDSVLCRNPEIGACNQTF